MLISVDVERALDSLRQEAHAIPRLSTGFNNELWTQDAAIDDFVGCAASRGIDAVQYLCGASGPEHLGRNQVLGSTRL